jgi:hypothetical protein
MTCCKRDDVNNARGVRKSTQPAEGASLYLCGELPVYLPESAECACKTSGYGFGGEGGMERSASPTTLECSAGEETGRPLGLSSRLMIGGAGPGMTSGLSSRFTAGMVLRGVVQTVERCEEPFCSCSSLCGMT